MILISGLRLPVVLTRMAVLRCGLVLKQALYLPGRCHVNSQLPPHSQPDDVLRLEPGATTEQTRAATEQTALTEKTAAHAGLPKIIKFDSLARCGDEIWIENEGQIYRLRKTRQGKLILTK